MFSVFAGGEESKFNIKLFADFFDVGGYMAFIQRERFVRLVVGERSEYCRVVVLVFELATESPGLGAVLPAAEAVGARKA